MRRRLAVSLLRLSNADLWREFEQARAAQHSAPNVVEERHRHRLADILRYSVASVPAYHEWARTQNLCPDQVDADDLARFPVTDKHVLMARREQYLAAIAVRYRVASHTGGSSGTIFHFDYDSRAKDARRASDFLGRTWANWQPGDPITYIWGHTGDVSVAAGYKARLSDALMHRRSVLNAFDMDDSVIARYVQRLQRQKPSLIIGYASSLAFIAEYVARNGLAGIRPKGVISSAESLGPEKRAVITREFDCPVYDRYGSREFANVAQQCEELAGLHVLHERVHVELLRQDGAACGPGELGEITITDLENRVMPFIRYRTGDLGVWAQGPCKCGRAWPVLESVQGRTSEIIVGPNGKYYACPGPTWLGADIRGIGQLQLIQHVLTAVEVRIVPNAEWNSVSEGLIASRMRHLLGEVSITITLVDRIPPAASGKHQIVVSNVSPFRVVATPHEGAGQG